MKLRPATAARTRYGSPRRSLAQRAPAAPAFVPPRNGPEAATRLAAYRDEQPRAQATVEEVNAILDRLSDNAYGALREAIDFLQRHEHPPRA